MGKQKASELTAWVETYCKSDWLKEKLSEASEAPESDEKMWTGLRSSEAVRGMIQRSLDDLQVTAKKI